MPLRPVRRRSARLPWGAAAMALLVGLTGCAAAPAGTPEVTGPFASCATVPVGGSAGVVGGSTAPAGGSTSTGPTVGSTGSVGAPAGGSAGGSTAAAAVASGPGSEAPDEAPMMAALSLPCFAGGPAVELARLGRPAVLNLWASWCGPCRAELPVFQQFANGPAGRIAVLGVVTGDTRSAAASFAADRSVTFPALFDPDSTLQHSGLMPLVLPVTLFVDAAGRLRHVEAVPIKDLSTLEDLAHRYLAVGS